MKFILSCCYFDADSGEIINLTLVTLRRVALVSMEFWSWICFCNQTMSRHKPKRSEHDGYFRGNFLIFRIMNPFANCVLRFQVEMDFLFIHVLSVIVPTKFVMMISTSWVNRLICEGQLRLASWVTRSYPSRNWWVLKSKFSWNSKRSEPMFQYPLKYAVLRLSIS